MDKHTTFEEFEKAVAEYMPNLKRDKERGLHAWGEYHNYDPERAFPRTWGITLSAYGKDGYVESADLYIEYGVTIQYSAENGSAATIHTNDMDIPMYRDGSPLTTFEKAKADASEAIERIERIMGLAAQLEHETWEMNDWEGTETTALRS